jgi:hypothetical protein
LLVWFDIVKYDDKLSLVIHELGCNDIVFMLFFSNKKYRKGELASTEVKKFEIS